MQVLFQWNDLKWILSSVLKCDHWTDHHGTSTGQRKIWVPDRNRTHDLPNTKNSDFLCPALVSCWSVHFSSCLLIKREAYYDKPLSYALFLSTNQECNEYGKQFASTVAQDPTHNSTKTRKQCKERERNKLTKQLSIKTIECFPLRLPYTDIFTLYLLRFLATLKYFNII